MLHETVDVLLALSILFGFDLKLNCKPIITCILHTVCSVGRF